MNDSISMKIGTNSQNGEWSWMKPMTGINDA